MIKRGILTAALLLAGASQTAVAGPPWISIEFPANPHHASTRNASFLIRAYHHSTGIVTRIDAAATGMVDGKRQTMELDVRATDMKGVYALHTPLPRNGTWVLSLTMYDGDSPATALVSVDRRGAVSKVSVPSGMSNDGWVVPRAVTQADVESALKEAIALETGRDLSRRAAVGAPIGLLLVAVAMRLRRRAGGAPREALGG